MVIITIIFVLSFIHSFSYLNVLVHDLASLPRHRLEVRIGPIFHIHGTYCPQNCPFSSLKKGFHVTAMK